MLNERSSGVEMRPEVQALLKELNPESARPVLSRASFERWRLELGASPQEDRRELAEHLIALAIRFEREAPKKTTKAVQQLKALATIVLCSEQLAQALLTEIESRREQAAAAFQSFTGGSSSTAAASQSAPEGTAKVGLARELKRHIRG